MKNNGCLLFSGNSFIKKCRVGFPCSVTKCLSYKTPKREIHPYSFGSGRAAEKVLSTAPITETDDMKTQYTVCNHVSQLGSL